MTGKRVKEKIQRIKNEKNRNKVDVSSMRERVR